MGSDSSTCCLNRQDHLKNGSNSQIMIDQLQCNDPILYQISYDNTHSPSSNIKIIYQGQLKNNLPHGKGKEIHSKNSENIQLYQGQFNNGLKQGYGQYHFQNGLKYYGQFKNNIIEGKGKMIWPNGTSYQGEFKNNLMNGFGIYNNKCEGKEYQYKGMYENGKKHGEGEMRMGGNGKWSKGYWVNGKVVRLE